MWAEQEGRDPPFTGARILAEMKKTDRQRDYPFIGELARRMTDPRDRLMFSRSPEDLIELATNHPELWPELIAARRVLSKVSAGRRALAEALQLEMLDLIEANERRLAVYQSAASAWAATWPALAREIDHLPLAEAHATMLGAAQRVLPESPHP